MLGTNEYLFTPGLILVVEDEPDLREVVIEILQLEGYSVVGANNGYAALELLKRGLKPALVLLDIMMPVMTGTEFLEKIREDVAWKELPVVVVSASTSPEALVGAKQYIRKPCSGPELLEAVRRLQLREPGSAWNARYPTDQVPPTSA